MSRKLIARIMDVYTADRATNEKFIAPVGGTCDSLPLDGRWNRQTIEQKVDEAISKRLKHNILRDRVGFAVYSYGSGGMTLQWVVILNPKYKDTPRKFL